MKLSNTEGILILTSSVLMMVAIFHKPIGLPDYFEGILMLAAVICFFVITRLRRRAKSQSMSIPSSTPPNPRPARRPWLIISVLALSCVSWPFIAPYTGTVLPFTQLVIIAIVTFILSVGIVLFVRRNQQP